MTEERTPMEWTERVGPFTATVDAVAGIVDDIVESGRPGLGEWDLGTLAHHTFRAVTTRQRYLAAATTQGRRELPDAAGYLAVYLDRRAADPERMDRTVAQRARDEAHPMPALAAAFRQAATWSASSLHAHDPSLLVATPFGTLRLDEYVRTRSFELVVHGLDLAHARDTPANLPEAALDDALSLLADLARRTGRQAEVIRMLTGRTPTMAALMQ